MADEGARASVRREVALPAYSSLEAPPPRAMCRQRAHGEHYSTWLVSFQEVFLMRHLIVLIAGIGVAALIAVPARGAERGCGSWWRCARTTASSTPAISPSRSSTSTAERT